jgi:hypothetical protein
VKPAYKAFYRITAVKQVAEVRYIDSGHFFLGTHLGYIGQSGKDALSVQVTQAAFYIQFCEHLRIDLVGSGGQCRKILDLRRDFRVNVDTVFFSIRSDSFLYLCFFLVYFFFFLSRWIPANFSSASRIQRI